MISIVVCSIDEKLLKQFKDNVYATIGLAYEIIAIDNRTGEKGICEVYNEGLKKATHAILCFCHEDILFETNAWGKQLIELLRNDEIGLVGIAGAVYKSKYPNTWAAIPMDYYRLNLTQQLRDGNKNNFSILDPGNYSEVAVIDGCFIAGRKVVFDTYKWNDALLKHFHLYDIDISLRVGKILKIVVANKIKMLHLSEGVPDAKWLIESEKFHQYYKADFPLAIKGYLAEKAKLDYVAFSSYVLLLLKLKQPFSKILSIIFMGFISFPFKKNNFSLLKQLFFRSI